MTGFETGFETDNANTPMHEDYERVAQAIRFLEESYQEQPELDKLATHLNLSSFHLQRLFTRWAGISPKRFVQFLTAEHAKRLLADQHSVLDATYDAGLSSPGRLHDLLIAAEAVTPGEFKNQGAGLTIHYGHHATPFGECLLAATERGVCHLAFLNGHGWEGEVATLQTRWSAATLVEDAQQTQRLVEQIFPAEANSGVNEKTNGQANKSPQQLNLLLKGTNFQLKVWNALLQIPPGEVRSYEDIATAIGQPSAVRAVGSAVGANNIAYLIPCHRVIRKTGLIQEYRWGSTRKKALIGWEAAQRFGEN
jgi:AraC family transcriptional regulator, regulatory protein of adaptative response / methylated-DNA-[protein]-cysteine methyltransferase